MVDGRERRVLTVIDSLDGSGGAEQSLAAVAPVLGGLGVVMTVVALRGRGGLRSGLERAGVEVVEVEAAGRRSAYEALRRIIRDTAPHLVHTTLFEADLAGRLAARREGVPVVSSLVNAPYGPEHLRAPDLRPAKVRAAHLADAATAQLVRRFHAISEYVAGTMARRLLVPRRRIDVITRGRDPVRLGRRTPERAAAVRHSLGIAPGAPVLLVAARQEWQKGVDLLPAVLPAVRRRVPGLVCLVAGRSGGMSGALHAAFDGDPEVRFLGSRDDVPDLLAAADVFLMPSRWEGLGGILIEAMALEAPTVATDLPTVGELAGGIDWPLVAPARPAELAEAVVALITGARSLDGPAARRRFEQEFTTEVVAGRTAAFYERSLAAPRRWAR